MASELSAPPVLSTPDSHILSEIEPSVICEPSQRLSDEQIAVRYEIERTIEEIRRNRWRRVALQFPDSMLSDSARVYQLLARGLKDAPIVTADAMGTEPSEPQIPLEKNMQDLGLNETDRLVKLTILGDTSYGSCCVDEIAAEHVDADAVVHYGRSCLSKTARLPIVYVFTTRKLDYDAVCKAFEGTFLDKETRVVVTADTPYAEHVEKVVARLTKSGYMNLFASSIAHDPSSHIPNRTTPDAVKQDPSQMKDWDLFHISDPPTSLLLTLSSRMRSVHIYPTTSEANASSLPHQANTTVILRRRYALVTSLSTVSTWGILINTLSVKNYLDIVDHVRKQISNAGKKSYLFVVGKLNPAKVANFAEIGGWVVIGCWESSLVDSKEFFRPIITPFELDLVLVGDENRVWTGEWRSDFQGVLDRAEETQKRVKEQHEFSMPGAFVDDELQDNKDDHDFDSDEESAPPEFDLRTGRYVSHSRPMKDRSTIRETRINGTHIAPSQAIVNRSNGELFSVKGVASPAAEFLAQKRTWRGLGSDFQIQYEDEEEQGGLIEEGRTGVASGYAVGDSARS